MRVTALVCIICSLVFFIIGSSCPAFSAAIDDDQDGSQSGTVYVMTNAAAANSIVVLHRNDDGSLVRLDEIPTGGREAVQGRSLRVLAAGRDRILLPRHIRLCCRPIVAS